MSRHQVWRALILAGLAWTLLADFAKGQLFTVPSQAETLSAELSSLKALQTARMDPTIFQFYTEFVSPVQDPGNAVSRLDLAASKNARKEFDKGYVLLVRKQAQAAVEHLARAIALHPNFVAAHNALGIAYLNLGQNQQAHDEFARAVALDDRLPGTYLNLGCAQMQLQRYAEAEESLKRASAIAPVDLVLLKALAYAQFKNRDYPGVIATTRRVHHRKHSEAALVHLFAAGAWEAQDRLSEAQDELATLLSEDSKSPLQAQVRKVLEQLKTEQTSRAQLRRASPERPNNPIVVPASVATCSDCPAGDPSGPLSSANSVGEQFDVNVAHQVIRVQVQEVAMLFGVTDHGRAVTNLTPANVQISDDGKPPQAILGFHNIAQLPLRIGLVIDMSNSITERFLFEEATAGKFLERVVTDKNDLAFVVGFNCSVRLAQDYTSDQTLTSRALAGLAPGGGTALWDAVAYAADKLASRPEVQPVARVLVVISDGEDNSSNVSLQQAIWAAERGEIAVYAVSTKEGAKDEFDPLVGTPALKKLTEQTGGALFKSMSLGDLDKRLADLQQVLRGRYLVYYKPASSQTDGRYHAVDLKAEVDGHKLKVYARKGYYASALVDAGI